MTDILCDWLNNDIQVSTSVDPKSFAFEFSNGYLIGEVLNKYQLQDDFGQFSQSKTADSKLNNFSRVEPVLKLLGIPFDPNIARSIMVEEPGVATRLVYQLFISLENKRKANLTGVAMETMRPAAPAKLQGMESLMYKERLKVVTPRQTDLNLRELVDRFHQHQVSLEERAFRLRVASAENHREDRDRHRDRQMERTRLLKVTQSELMAKIEAAVVHIPKPPPNKTAHALAERRHQHLSQEANEAMHDLDCFDDRLKRMLPSTRVQEESESSSSIGGGRSGVEVPPASAGPAGDALQLIMPASNDEYIGRIRRRLEEDAHARSEREKRRRKVLVDCLSAHAGQEESRREELMVNRLMRQSQMERRIAVQLLQARHEKSVLKSNRMNRERQYQEQREREFVEAMEREKAMAQEARLACAEELAHEAATHHRLVAERLQAKYKKHYELCFDVTTAISDLACRVGEYRGYTERKLPRKLYRDWASLFVDGKPLYEEAEESPEEQERVDIINEESCKILDESDLMEYRSFTGEWIPPEEAEVKECPVPNPIIGYIVNRLHNIVFPPSPPPSKPEFPPYPIKAAVVGKCFAGKTSVIQKLMENNRCVTFVVEKLVEEAIEAFRNNEMVEETPTEEAVEAPVENTGRESTDTQGTEVAASSIPVDQSSSVHSLTGAVSPAVPPPPPAAELKQKSNLSSRSKESDKPRLTNRAKIGQKLVKSLKKGKAMDDGLQVEVLVEAIRQVPEGTGWILDGFPTNYNQAKLLEKALTGYDENAGKNRRGRRPTLASNPRAQPSNEEVKSGLDAVILMDMEDINCLNRAVGRTEAPISGEQFHYDSNPPPDGSATGMGKVERVQPVQDASHDLDQIQARLTAFLEAWPKLDKFYSRFGPSLVHRVDGNLEALALYLEVERTLDDIVNKDSKVEETQVVEPESVEPPPPPPEPEQPAPVPEPLPEPPKEEVKRSRPGSKKGSRAGSAKRGSSKGSDKGSPAGSRKKSGRSRAGSQEKEDKKGKKGSRVSSAKSRSRSGSKGSKKGKSPEPPPPEPEPEVPAGPPPPEPGSEEWEFVDKDIPVEIATALMPLWDAIEEAYMNALKANFRDLRFNREQMIKYFHEVRTDFIAYLRRPDHKQELLSSFQKDFNDIPDDMREDEDVMQDLHQRIDDLRDKLFDMTDERKAAAEEKREEVMKTGWVEDRIGILSNHYISLMQAEYDRFQDSAKFLKDYYKSMNVTIPEEFKSDFTRLPLLDLPVEKEEGEGGDAEGEGETEPPVKAPSPGGKKGKKETAAEAEPHELTDAEIEAMFKTKIQLLPLRPSSTDIATAAGVIKAGKEGKGKPGKDKKQERTIETPQPPSDPDEKVLFDAFWNGIQLVLNYISNEQSLREAEEEAEKAKQAEKEKEKEKNANAKDKGGKGGKGGGKGKGKSRSPSPKKGGKDKGKGDEPPATPVDAEESEEEKQKREMKERMRKEYFAALEKEAAAARTRMELVKLTGAQVITDLKKKSEDVFKDMFDWIGSRMLKENEVIDELTVILRYAVEAHDRIAEKIDVQSDNFVLRADLMTLEAGVLPSRPSPIEQIEPDQFKIKQIENIFKRLKAVSPAGLMSATEFVAFFQDIGLASQDSDALPETWRQASPSQLHELAEALSPDKEYVSWRAFLLAISQPWPWPSQQQLLETLNKFRDLDQLGTGRITREQFDFVDLWFTASTLPPTPTDPDQPKVLDRLGAVKKLFFDFFLDDESGVDYEAMLMHFAASASAYVGFLRALSLTVGRHVMHAALPGSEQETAVDPASEEIPNDTEDVLLPIEALYKVLTFGQQAGKEKPDGDHEDCEEKKEGISMEVLVSIYQQLGSDNLDPLPFSVLLRHAALVELILQNKQFKVVDLKAFMSDPGDIHSVRTTAE